MSGAYWRLLTKGKDAMSTTTERRLSRFADALEAVARFIINVIELVVLDAATPKRIRNARRGRQPRAPRQPRVAQERVIIRPSAPRVYVVKERK
jgi:hypothetical protein